MSIENILKQIEGETPLVKEAADEELEKISQAISKDLAESVFESAKEKLAEKGVILGGKPKNEVFPTEMLDKLIKEKSASLKDDKSKLFKKLARLSLDKFKVTVDQNFEERSGSIEGPDMFNQTIPDATVNKKEG